jgi:hypothetical protein
MFQDDCSSGLDAPEMGRAARLCDEIASRRDDRTRKNAAEGATLDGVSIRLQKTLTSSSRPSSQSSCRQLWQWLLSSPLSALPSEVEHVKASAAIL